MYSEKIEATLKKAGIKPGDAIKLTTQKGAFEGVLIPRPDLGDNSILILKLKNGYNIGIRFEGNSKIEKIESGKRETFSFPKVELKKRKNLPNVKMFITGGTIVNKVDYETGGVYPLAKPEELLYLVPELEDVANIEIDSLMSVASEDLTYKEWAVIAKAVAETLNSGSNGVVILHGTDTMHYTSAALSFMLKGLNAPVVLTGAQRSSDRGSSDAFMNLVCATRIAAQSDVAEVGICMHADSSDDFCIFTRGTKVRKMHTSRRDAFRPINSKPMAKVGIKGDIEYPGKYANAVPGEAKVKAVTGFEPKVALVKFYPNSDPSILDYYIGEGYKGVIIEGTGLGHVAVSPKEESRSWLKHIEKAVDSGLIVGMTSQCLNGRVNTNVYSPLRRISGAGAIYCEDMLPEVALVKLGFLLGNYKKEEAAKMLDKNLVGEITKRTEIDTYP